MEKSYFVLEETVPGTTTPTPAPGTTTQIGKSDYTTAWNDYDTNAFIAVNSGETYEAKFYSRNNGTTNIWNNFVVVLGNMKERYNAVVRADNAIFEHGDNGQTSWTSGVPETLGWTLTPNWTELNDRALDNKLITLTVTNDGTKVIVTAQATGYYETLSLPLGDGKVSFQLWADGAYLEVIQQPTKTSGGSTTPTVTPTPTPGTAPATDVTRIGATDFSTDWWGERTESIKVPVGYAVTRVFENHSNKADNGNNFLVALQPTNNADNFDTGMYAALRADNLGWWKGVAGNDLSQDYMESNWDFGGTDFANFRNTLDGATVILTVTNFGETAEVLIQVEGTEYYQKYFDIPLNEGGDLYFYLSVVKAYLLIDNSRSKSEVTPSATLPANFFNANMSSIKTGSAAAGVSIHDPSIFVENGTYYIFGTHQTAARSTNLRTWTNVNGVYSSINNNAQAFAWAGRGDSKNPAGTVSVWAPDVIYNPTMGKYLMYLSFSSTSICSNIGLAVANTVTGPYTYVGPVIYSGFTSSTVSSTDAAQYTTDRYPDNSSANASFPNAIDPNVFFDKDGRLWMSYGSWSGGIWLLELDPATGLRLKNSNAYDHPYFGYKLGGGNKKSGEGPYILYDAEAGYYYLFVSYGWLENSGGYQIRVFRSENVAGPYVDQRGNSYKNMTSGDQTKFGLKLSGNYTLPSLPQAYKATGHNSAFIENGKRYLVYHTRFETGGEYFEPRVRQYVLNEDKWPCLLPYATNGETVSASGYTMEDVAGRYYVENQGIGINGDIATPEILKLNADGTYQLKGSTGTWSMENGTPYMHIQYDGITFDGVFCQMKDEAGSQVMTFSASGQNYTLLGVKY